MVHIYVNLSYFFFVFFIHRQPLSHFVPYLFNLSSLSFFFFIFLFFFLLRSLLNPRSSNNDLHRSSNHRNSRSLNPFFVYIYVRNKNKKTLKKKKRGRGGQKSGGQSHDFRLPTVHWMNRRSRKKKKERGGGGSSFNDDDVGSVGLGEIIGCTLTIESKRGSSRERRSDWLLRAGERGRR